MSNNILMSCNWYQLPILFLYPRNIMSLGYKIFTK